MPHVEIKYSDDLQLDFDHLFQCIETIIYNKDQSSGRCKSRAYPAITFKHSHIIVEIALLQKEHRDQAFTQDLSQSIADTVKSMLKPGVSYSVLIKYNPKHFISNSK